ncbi:MAG TPA: hypothetical protein VKU89_06535 [Solirubrobacteraceae bacterium]|nr:hypothetical protein [Solirubrobacteraceae bacterium]
MAGHTPRAWTLLGWIIARRKTRPCALISPAAAQARNTYRDIFAAVFDYGVREGLLTHSPLAEVNRKSKELERHERITTSEQYMA